MPSRTEKRDTFQEVLAAAVDDLMSRGFVSQRQIDEWLQKLEMAARSSLIPANELQRSLVDSLGRAYANALKQGRLMKRHAGISQFTLSSIKPKLRTELDRRILASANLIKLNREQAIQQTLQRFSGWATSIPMGGTKIEDRREVKKDVRRGIAGLNFRDRRVVIDQGHKLVAAVDDIIATDGGAIAGIWRHVKEGPPSYDSRPDHVARDGQYYVIRDNWALKKGLMKLAGRKYTDQITMVGEEVYCSCWYEYVYTLSALPADMLTILGRDELARVRKQMAGWS